VVIVSAPLSAAAAAAYRCTIVLWLCLLPATYPRPRYSSKTSARRLCGSAKAPSLSVPNTCKQEPGSTQLEVPIERRFHNKTCNYPLALSPTRHPPKTPLLHQNESLPDVRRRYGSAFVIA
jgi:hypothetical protein